MLRLLTQKWRDAAWRAVVFQALLILAVMLLGAWIVSNTLGGLEQRGISTGFDFLSQTAGFGIIQTLVEYNESFTFGRTFVVGLLNTLLVSALGVFFATVLGFVVGISRLSSNWLLARLAEIYIEIFRNIPLLLQIFFWYFAVLGVLPGPRQSVSFFDSIFLNVRGIFLPQPVVESGGSLLLWAVIAGIICALLLSLLSKRKRMITGRSIALSTPLSIILLMGLPALAVLVGGVEWYMDRPELIGFNFSGGMVLLPEMAALLFALTIYTAAFIAEVVRSGIESVSKGQKEAAAALGLRPGRVLKLVVIPQAMRVIIPPLTNQCLNLIKNSSLATAIGYPDLVNVFAGTTLNQTGQAVEVIAMTMAVYLVISLIVSLIMNLYNRYTKLVER